MLRPYEFFFPNNLHRQQTIVIRMDWISSGTIRKYPFQSFRPHWSQRLNLT